MPLGGVVRLAPCVAMGFRVRGASVLRKELAVRVGFRCVVHPKWSGEVRCHCDR